MANVTGPVQINHKVIHCLLALRRAALYTEHVIDLNKGTDVIIHYADIFATGLRRLEDEGHFQFDGLKAETVHSHVHILYILQHMVAARSLHMLVDRRLDWMMEREREIPGTYLEPGMEIRPYPADTPSFDPPFMGYTTTTLADIYEGYARVKKQEQALRDSFAPSHLVGLAVGHQRTEVANPVQNEDYELPDPRLFELSDDEGPLRSETREVPRSEPPEQLVPPEPIEPGEVRQDDAERARSTIQVHAIRGHRSQLKGDLQFDVGQAISVTGLESLDWLRGEYRDEQGIRQEGIFPRDFVVETYPRALARSRDAEHTT
jgi:hypothetical protein